MRVRLPQGALGQGSLGGGDTRCFVLVAERGLCGFQIGRVEDVGAGRRGEGVDVLLRQLLSL